MSRKLYFISGLGANEQVFSQLKLANTQAVYLQWILPAKDETVEEYAARMYKQVEEEHPVIIGLSFGGMIAVEMAKQFPVAQVILISSAATKNELPWWMKAAGKLHLHKMIKSKPNPLLYPVEDFFLGASAEKEKKLVAGYRQAVNEDYLQWAIDAIVGWKNVTIPHNLTHIHGTRDKIFPIRNIKAEYCIAGGGHFMVYNKAGEISKIVNGLL